MPTDSTAEMGARFGGARRQGRRLALTVVCLVSILAGTACALRRAVVVDDLLEPLGSPATHVPSPADLAAAHLARTALVSSARRAPTSPSPEPPANSADSKSRNRAEAQIPGALAAAFSEFEQAKKDGAEKRLLDLATDLRNTTLDDPIAYRTASRALRHTRGIDPRLASRLDQVIGEDPLSQARSRNRDDWHRLFARTFNSIVEPIGQTAITGFFLAPYNVANSVTHYFAEFSNSEPLSLTDRQALVLREEFLAAHPDSEIAPKVEKLVVRDRAKLAKTLARRRLRAGDRALDQGQPELALHHGRATLHLLAEYPDDFARLHKQASKLEERASAALAERERRDARSLEARATSEATRTSERALSLALFPRPVAPGELDPELARYLAEAGRNGHGRVEFVKALAQNEAGYEEPARQTLARLAGAAQGRDPMTRHAKQLLDDDWQNPYDAFRRLRRKGRREALGFRLAGEWVNRPHYPNLWPPVAYLIDLPTIAMTLVMAPIRALISPFTGFPDFQRATALAGYRYLLLYPEGAHQRELVTWLYDYEKSEDRYGRALRLADLIPDFPERERQKLVEKSASEQIEQLAKVDRRDQRSSVLRGIVTEFPDSKGGRDAGMKAREELEKASPQHIRITRGFLLENPGVAGQSGLALNPVLLNGDRRDGELHAEGVVLRGDRVLEILLLAEGRDEDAPPVSRLRRISQRRLTQLTAALDEAVRANSLVDAGAGFASDANRETYLERARLGLTDDPELRATAESTFVYESLRERYGMVRGRDSILPFDLVFRGSLGDFTLGAFPRWRPPPETDDAFLYR